MTKGEIDFLVKHYGKEAVKEALLKHLTDEQMMEFLNDQKRREVSNNSSV